MSILITNAETLFFEGDDVTVKKASLYIKDGVIADVDAPPEQTADKVIDAAGMLAMPGLINCHTHMYMSIFRNYADDLPFNEWLFEKIMPVEDTMTAEDAYWCNLLSSLEMIESGTTTFLDMHMFPGQCTRAAQQSGMRGVVARGLSSQSGDDGGNRRLNEALSELENAKKSDALVHFCLGPHAIYTCDDSYLQELVAVAEKQDLTFTIHLSETRHEYETSLKENGCTPTEHVEKLGLLSRSVVAAHCVYLSDNDVDILKKHNVHVATNPISNLKLANGVAPVEKLFHHGINVCLGTDGAASNNSQNMFKEMAVLSYIHKGTAKNALATPANRVLQMATINGAAALGMAQQIGSIEAGKRADIILLDLNRPHLRPLNNIAAGLVYSANGSEVNTVIIDGKMVMQNREVLTIDKERVFHEIERIQKELL